MCTGEHYKKRQSHLLLQKKFLLFFSWSFPFKLSRISFIPMSENEGKNKSNPRILTFRKKPNRKTISVLQNVSLYKKTQIVTHYLDEKRQTRTWEDLKSRPQAFLGKVLHSDHCKRLSDFRGALVEGMSVCGTSQRCSGWGNPAFTQGFDHCSSMNCYGVTPSPQCGAGAASNRSPRWSQVLNAAGCQKS